MSYKVFDRVKYEKLFSNTFCDLNDLDVYSFYRYGVECYLNKILFLKEFRVSKAISSITSNGSLNGNLVNLKNKLTNLKNAVNIIIKYQKLEREIQELKRRLSTASKYAINSIRRQIASKERTLALYESQIDRFLSR